MSVKVQTMEKTWVEEDILIKARPSKGNIPSMCFNEHDMGIKFKTGRYIPDG